MFPYKSEEEYQGQERFAQPAEPAELASSINDQYNDGFFDGYNGEDLFITASEPEARPAPVGRRSGRRPPGPGNRTPGQRPPNQGQRPPNQGQRPPMPSPGNRPPRPGTGFPPSVIIPVEPGRLPGGAPGFRPPGIIPQRGMETRVINPAALSRCAGGLAYLWLINGESGWLYISGVYDSAVAGYTWTKMGWVYTAVSTDFIGGFYCYG